LEAPNGTTTSCAAIRYPTLTEPSRPQNTVDALNYLIDFQRGWFFNAKDVQPVRYRNAMMTDDNSESREDNIIEMKWLVQRELGSSVVFFHEVTIPPGTVEGTHRHIGTEELYFITEGKGIAYMADGDDPNNEKFPIVERDIYTLGKLKCRELPVEPGSVIFTKSGGVHGIRNDGTAPQIRGFPLSHCVRRKENNGYTGNISRLVHRHDHDGSRGQHVRCAQGTTPNYDQGNSLVKLLGVMEHAELAAERQTYIAHSLEYLFAIKKLEFYGPAGADFLNTNPATQDNKNDFQKQNVRDFTLTDTHLIRGWTTVGDSVLPFLRLSYRGGPDTLLSEMTGHRLGQRIKAWVRVGDTATSSPIPVPYNPDERPV
jgi:mannose-6-phosphate isomerase-like protein (cupin superfamily)